MKAILLSTLLAAALVASDGLASTNRNIQPPASEEEAAQIKKVLPSDAPAKPARPRRILLFTRCEGFVHKSIPFGVKAFELLGEKTGAYSVEESQEMEAFSPENLKRFDAVLFLSTSKLDPSSDQREALLEFVRGGKGIIGIHAATDNFYEWEEGARMMGGLFCGHPWTAGCTVQVKLDEPDHPINDCFEGESFRITDEIYQFKDPYSRRNQRIITSLDMSDPDTRQVKGGKPDKVVRTDGDFGITWVRREGLGRVFYCSLGHNHHVYRDARILQHYLAGIQYALGDLDVPDEIPPVE